MSQRCNNCKTFQKMRKKESFPDKLVVEGCYFFGCNFINVSFQLLFKQYQEEQKCDKGVAISNVFTRRRPYFPKACVKRNRSVKVIHFEKRKWHYLFLCSAD